MSTLSQRSSPDLRSILIERRAKAVKAHAPRSHIDRDLIWLTVQQLQDETKERWPLAVVAVCATLGAAIVLILLVAGSVK